MQQQINLFQPVFRREEKVFSARALVQVLVIALLLLVGGTAVLQVQHAKLASTRGFLEGQQRSLENQLAQLETQADPVALTALDERIAALEARLSHGETELAQMRELLIERKTGFATLLEALARHPQRGLWLTDIQQLNGALELKGRTFDAMLVPHYLDALSADAGLKRWSLSTVQVGRDAEDGEQLVFTLRADPAEVF